MLYDLATEPPMPGSLLESVFLLISKRRQESEYHKTKLLMLSSFAHRLEGGAKQLEEALTLYRQTMFPFLEDEKRKMDVDSKKVLKSWTSKILKIRPLWRAKDHAPLVSKLRRGAERIKESEKARRLKPHRRI